MTTPEQRPPAPAGSGLLIPDDRARLDRLAQIATSLGAEPLRARIAALAQRIDEGRFYLACIGAFKRGKSTLLNALVGLPVLPAGIVPVTTVPTIVQYGPELLARIRFTTGEVAVAPVGEVRGYVSEAENPRNVRGVEVVEVFLPSPLLRDGLCLVDTPGLGSVFQESTAATRAFVPQIDAALVVVGADPPLSGEELQLITVVAAQVRHLIVVLNKADRFPPEERAEAIRFTDSVLARVLGRSVGPILEVSARERLAGVGPERDWGRLLEALDALTTSSGRALVHAALERGVAQLARQCLRELDEASAALFRPVDESDRRMEQLRFHVGHLAHESLRLGFRMEHAAEEAARDAAGRRRAFLQAVIPEATAELRRALRGVAGGLGPARRRRAGELARTIAASHLTPWLAEARRRADATYRALAARFVEEARRLLAESPELRALEVGDLSEELEPIDRLLVASRLEGDDRPMPPEPRPSRWRWCLDVAGPRRWVDRIIARDAEQYLVDLLTQGARAADDDFDWRFGRTEERLKHAVHTVLETAYEAADRAVARARAVRAEGEEAYHREIQRLLAMRQEVIALAAPPGARDATAQRGPLRSHSDRSPNPHPAPPQGRPSDT
jgi:hypothetical protein